MKAPHKAASIGPIMLSAIVISSMIGGGTYSIPQSMAQNGVPAAIILAWLVTAVGMFFIAFTFKILSEVRPNLTTGIYAYSRDGFGDLAGFGIASGFASAAKAFVAAMGATPFAQGGVVTVTATSASGLTASVDILVIDCPDSMTIQRGGSNISSLTLTPGATAELSVSVIYNHMELETVPSDFTWSVDPSLGTIDQNGVLQAGFTEGKGYITVTKGTSTVTIPLTIDGKSPFVDTEGHWGSTYLTSLYYQGILTGVTVDGKLYAYPDRGVTREEFAVLLSRYMGINTADYAAVEVPFADMDQVDSWAADAVRAMYALGIVGGSTVNGQQVFNPDGTLTRAEAVTMLGRMQTYEGVTPADLSGFSDAASVPPYAVEHFQTMVALGVIGGSDGKLDPNGTMTRAAVCKVLATMP